MVNTTVMMAQMSFLLFVAIAADQTSPCAVTAAGVLRLWTFVMEMLLVVTDQMNPTLGQIALFVKRRAAFAAQAFLKIVLCFVMEMLLVRMLGMNYSLPAILKCLLTKDSNPILVSAVRRTISFSVRTAPGVFKRGRYVMM